MKNFINRLRKYFPIKKVIRDYIMMLMVTIIVCSTIIACDNDNNPEIPSQGNYTVKVEISCSIPGSCSDLKNVEISWLKPGTIDEAEIQVVNRGENWTETVVYEGIPETAVGALINPNLTDDIQEGAEISVDYSYGCKVTLLDDDKVVDFTNFDNNQSYTLTYDSSEDHDLSERILYTVTPQGIQKSQTVVEEEPAVEDKQKEFDEERERVNRKIHYFSLNDDATNSNYLYDNLLARFSQRVLWDGSPVGKGEFLFLYRNDIEKAPADIISQSLENGAILIIDGLSSYSQITGFCNSQGIHNPLADEELDVQHTMFIIANSSENIGHDQNVNYNSLFFVLNPSTEDKETITDYEQGLMVDQAVSQINDILNSNNSRSSAISRSAVENLEQLVGAQRVLLSDCVQTVGKSNYVKAKDNKDQSNIYSVILDIWNVYSVSENANYYYIHQEFLGAFQPCYKDIYVAKAKTPGFGKSIAKICEYYGDHVSITTTPAPGTGNMLIHRQSPKTTEGATTYSSGIEWNLAGEVGFIGKDKTGNVTSGVTLNSSQSYTINDVTVSNLCEPGRQLKWTFDFAKPRASFHPFYKAGTSFKEGALAGRSSFSSGMDYIVSFPVSSTPKPKMHIELEVAVKSDIAKGGRIDGWTKKTIWYYKTFSLPTLNEKMFRGK